MQMKPPLLHSCKTFYFCSCFKIVNFKLINPLTHQPKNIPLTPLKGGIGRQKLNSTSYITLKLFNS